MKRPNTMLTFSKLSYMEANNLLDKIHKAKLPAGAAMRVQIIPDPDNLFVDVAALEIGVRVSITAEEGTKEGWIAEVFENLGVK